MIGIRVDRRFAGPSLPEMGSLLGLDGSPLVVKWANTRVEREVLKKLGDRQVTLVVADISMMERTCVTLGLRFEISPEVSAPGFQFLNNPSAGRWRSFTTETGAPVTRGILVQGVADRLRKGKDLPPLRKLAVELVLENSPVAEIDILFGLRIAGVKG